MPEDIGRFKVVISGEVDTKVEKKLEESIEKGSKKGAEKFEKEFTNRFEHLVKSPSFKNLIEFTKTAANFGTNIAKGTEQTHYADPKKTSYMSMTNVESKQPLSESVAGGGASGGVMGAIIDLVAKLSLTLVFLNLIKKALDGLAPLQALIKMVVAILQITLYPIMQFFLAIFKPILMILLKYLILPFYYKVMPVLESLGKWIGETVAGILKDPAGAIEGLWAFVVEGTLKILTKLWEKLTTIWTGIVTSATNIFGTMIAILGPEFKIIADLFMDIGSFAITVFSGMVQNIVNIFTFLVKTILGVLNVLLSPFINLISRIIKNPFDAIGAFADFGEEIANTGNRIGDFAKDVQTNWEQLQNGTLNIINNIKSTGTKIFTDFSANVGNLFKIMKDANIPIISNLVDVATSSFSTISTKFNIMVDSMMSKMGATKTSGGGWGTQALPSWTSSTIVNAISAYVAGGGSTVYAAPTAEGGIFDKPSVRLIGEAGPEAVIPLNKLKNMGGTIINVSFPNMNVSHDIDIDDIITKIEKTFYTNAKRSGI